MACPCRAPGRDGAGGMAAASWYHRDISRVVAEDLLAKAGRDGCFLVRDSESVAGAYALCLLFQRHVHTYRILPDDEGLLSVQTIQGIQAKCFRTLPDLIGAYQQPNNGLVTPLLYPVHRPRDTADEDSGERGRVLRDGAAVKVGKSQRAALTVDVELGTVAITKKGSGSPEETIPQDKILQLIKYQSVQSKVRLVYDRDPQRSLSKDFVFPSARKREAFCQLLQLMKIQHSNLDEPDLISVYVGTWNMGSAPPPRSLASWLTSRGLGRTQDETTACIPHDIYVIGTQENSLGDREWVEFLRASLKTLMAIDYRVVALQCLWSIKMVVLVKPEHERRISHVHTSSVKTGIANTLGNKGAVGVSFLFNGTSFGFVNCHLASGSEKTHRRNQNYSDILRSLALGDKRLSAFDLTLRFTHLFWFGDLNYRLDMDVQDILTHVTKKEFDILLAVDQLTLEREKNKVFLQFREGDISFPPTYRYERGSRDSYMWQKFKTTGMRINVPSWCDRILWKSHPETHLVCNSYGCTDDIVTSDHSPVFATFEVGVTSQFVPKNGKDKATGPPLACIEWESIEVIVKTASRSKCYIEFHSYCLEEAQRSGENSSQSCDVPGFLKMGWSAKQLPVLNPILPDLEYLGDQHLLLSIKGVESCESYGECCIAMRSMIGSMAQQFETFLFHRGEETGSMRGWMKVRVPKERHSTRERLYGKAAPVPPCPCHAGPVSPAPTWGKSFEEEDDAPAADTPTCPKPPLRYPTGAAPPRTPSPGDAEPCPAVPRRSRPHSLPEASSYTNPAYFIFEGLPTAWALGTGEAPNTQAERGTHVPYPQGCHGGCSQPAARRGSGRDGRGGGGAGRGAWHGWRVRCGLLPPPPPASSPASPGHFAPSGGRAGAGVHGRARHGTPRTAGELGVLGVVVGSWTAPPRPCKPLGTLWALLWHLQGRRGHPGVEGWGDQPVLPVPPAAPKSLRASSSRTHHCAPPSPRAFTSPGAATSSSSPSSSCPRSAVSSEGKATPCAATALPDAAGSCPRTRSLSPAVPLRPLGAGDEPVAGGRGGLCPGRCTAPALLETPARTQLLLGQLP
uniref:phosphatidylinositol-3,4,5-trisphosphate 5-phosphatase n=1 Tax=Anser brachyrhynchus TaxID=132585 RepID=A0A8B9BE50_9AVES